MLVVLALMIHRRGWWISAFVGALLPLSLGVFAYFSGMAQAREAIQYASPEEQEFLLQMSRSVAVYPLEFGIFSTAFFVLVIGLRMYFKQRKAAKARAVT